MSAEKLTSDEKTKKPKKTHDEENSLEHQSQSEEKVKYEIG